MRRSIESHLLDSSPAVRDAAVELIGKYIIDFPQLAGNYYNKIADRIAVRRTYSTRMSQRSESVPGYWSGSSQAGHQTHEVCVHRRRRS